MFSCLKMMCKYNTGNIVTDSMISEIYITLGDGILYDAIKKVTLVFGVEFDVYHIHERIVTKKHESFLLGK